MSPVPKAKAISRNNLRPPSGPEEGAAMPWDPLGLSALARPLSQAAPLPNILASKVQRILAAGNRREVLNRSSSGSIPPPPPKRPPKAAVLNGQGRPCVVPRPKSPPHRPATPPFGWGPLGPLPPPHPTFGALRIVVAD